MFGQPAYGSMNAFLNSRFEQSPVLVVAHRGSGGGSVAVNTALAVKAAMLQGAGMVEIDVTASSDGEFYCFHDGTEAELLGIEANLQTLPSAEIDALRYQGVDRPGRSAAVERLLPLLGGFRDQVLFNIDRSWWRWPALLHALDRLGQGHQFVMKCPAWDQPALDRLREFPVKFPFVPICADWPDVERAVNDPQLNTVGVELITSVRHHDWFSPAVIERIHRLGVFVLVNAETLTTGVPLFAGLDDELAIQEAPHLAYGPMLDLGVDAIQTDWPAIVTGYRDSWFAEHGDGQA